MDDWRVDAGKRRTRERIVHGNEKDLGVRARSRAGVRVALRADLWFHDAASNNRRVTKWTFYRIIVLLRDAAPTAQ